MTLADRRLAGILLVAFPTVLYGGVTLLSMIADPEYRDNALRQDLWRAGHAHAGVLLVLSLVLLRYSEEARLPALLKGFVRLSAPIAAILMPLGFFLSVLSPDANSPNSLIYLTYAGGGQLALGLLFLGIGLIRRPA